MSRLLLFLLLVLPAVGRAADPASSSAGDVRFFRVANSGFDVFTRSPTVEQQAWMRSHYWRMLAYSPYYDSRLSWSSPAWAYLDLYAIYAGSTLASAHPEWILRDASGNPLYIPYGCTGSGCPQYAGDVGSPGFRANWLAQAGTILSHGYRGLFVDDVNMPFRVGDGTGQQVAPIDPRTGVTMTDVDWRRYVAEFTEAIAGAFPAIEIAHNAIWFAGHDDPSVQRELLSADWINLERGVNDGGIRGGGGQYGLETFFAHVDWLHARGKSVVFDGGATSDAQRQYALTAYFLVDDQHDGIGNNSGGTPADWWPGYDVSLGAPLGPRYGWSGLLRRDFTGGTVLLNEPGAAIRTVTLDGFHVDLTGQPRSSVTLGPAAGIVLLATTGTTTSTTTTTAPPSTAPSTTTTTAGAPPSSTTTSAPAPSTTTTVTVPATCGAAIVLPAEGGVFTGITVGTGGQTGSCGGGTAPERIFAWTPTRSGVATIDTCSGTATDHDTILYVRAGTCRGAELACNDDTPGCGIISDGLNPQHGSRVTPTVAAGTTYFIVVDGYATSAGVFHMTVVPPAAPTTTSTTLPPPCPGATVLPPGGGTIDGTTAGGSTAAGSCGGWWAPDQIYAWTPAVSGTATISTCSDVATDHDTIVYVREDGCDGAEVACNDDASGCGITTDGDNPHRGSMVTIDVTAGTTYAIVVDGFGSQAGNYRLSVVPPDASSPTTTTSTTLPSGCAGSTVLPPEGGTFEGTTTGGSSDAGSCGGWSAPDRTFVWTPTSSGIATVSTCGPNATDHDTVLYVRQGDCDGSEVACNDDTRGCGTTNDLGYPHLGSVVTFAVTAGTRYAIVVDAYAQQSGRFSLTVTPP